MAQTFNCVSIVHIGTFVPRRDLPQLAAVGQKFSIACADARFWQRLWYVGPGVGSSGRIRGHSVSACMRHAAHARSFRLTVGRLRREKVSDECKTVLSGLAVGLSSGHLHDLTVTGNFGVGADPIFGTQYEVDRQRREEDVLRILSTMCVPGPCQLRRLSLNMGSFSVDAFKTMLQVLRPPLEALLCEQALVTGWTFESVIAAVRDAHPRPDAFRHFASDEYIGGEDPLGCLASAFPNLRSLAVPRLYNTQPARLDRFPMLAEIKSGRFREALYGNFTITKSNGIYWFITSDKHDDDYRGHGLSWAEFDNISECQFNMRVGTGVSSGQVLSFMAKCGIQHRANLHAMSDSENSYEEEDD